MRPASILAKMTARSQCRTSEAARRSSPPASCGSAPKRDPTSDRPQLVDTLKEILFRVGRRSGYLTFGVFAGDFSDLLLLWPGSRFGADSHVVSCIKLTGPDKLTVPCHRRQVPISEQRRNQMLPRAVISVVVMSHIAARPPIDFQHSAGRGPPAAHRNSNPAASRSAVVQLFARCSRCVQSSAAAR